MASGLTSPPAANQLYKLGTEIDNERTEDPNDRRLKQIAFDKAGRVKPAP
jgi:hypothetical protein